ncbi:MAG: hypothetical protein CNE89_06315 [Sphingomonadaceae bacterium MED-G03]|nr:MAG: hypothetical protein CNE89_06315 [Sphingomonadaceae bacterium MED-G03]
MIHDNSGGHFWRNAGTWRLGAGVGTNAVRPHAVRINEAIGSVVSIFQCIVMFLFSSGCLRLFLGNRGAGLSGQFLAESVVFLCHVGQASAIFLEALAPGAYRTVTAASKSLRLVEDGKNG